MNHRTIGNSVGMLALVTATVLEDYWFADGLRYLALAVIFGNLLFRARTGYLRRRPRWTSDSWRRYVKAGLVPVGAFLIMVCMMFALEWRLPIVGDARSATRAVWALGTIIFMLIGAVGLVSVIEWMNEGEASKQFELPRWLRGRRGESA